MDCKNCGAQIKTDTCDYCGTKPEPQSKRRVIKSDRGRYDTLENTELRGDWNRVGKAINCLIVGDRNRVKNADSATVVTGEWNRVGVQ